jgi:hypothetical protein
MTLTGMLSIQVDCSTSVQENMKLTQNRKRLDSVKREYGRYNAVDVVEDAIKQVVDGKLVF